MRLVIDIPEAIYEEVMSGDWSNFAPYGFCEAIENGAPLPKGHGKLIDENDFEKRIAILTHSMDLGYGEIMDVIDEISPIIEADKESEK